MDLDQAEELAMRLMQKHLEDDMGELWWSFEYDTAVRRFGATHFRTKTISLSPSLTYLNHEDQVLDTILHEIAHALAGPNEGHGKVWKAIAKSIGCSGERCYSSSEVIKPRPKFVGTCPNCNGFMLRNRRTRLACIACCNTHNHGRWTDRFLISWARNDPMPSRSVDTIAASDVQ